MRDLIELWKYESKYIKNTYIEIVCLNIETIKKLALAFESLTIAIIHETQASDPHVYIDSKIFFS